MRRFLFFLFIVALTLLSATQTSPDSQRDSPKPYLRQARTEGLSKAILGFDLASGSNLAAAALSDLTVRVWRLDSGELVREFSFPEPATDQRLKLSPEIEPMCLHFSPDGKHLAVGFLNAIHLYDVVTWEEVTNLNVEGEDILRRDIRATYQRPELKPRTGEQAQIQSEKPELDINQKMRKWAAERERADGRTRISDFRFTKDGQFILASYCNGACWFWLGSLNTFPSGRDPVRLWDLRTKKTVWEKLYDAKGVISRIVPLPDHERFVAVDSELGRCAVGVYDLASAQTIWSHSLGPCLNPPVTAVVPNGQIFVTNRVEESDRKNQLWRQPAIYQTSDGRKIANLPTSDGIREADISSDGHWLVSINWKGTEFQVWDLQAKKIVVRGVPKGWTRTADHLLNLVRLSSDDRWLVIGSNLSGDMSVYQVNFGGSPSQ